MNDTINLTDMSTKKDEIYYYFMHQDKPWYKWRSPEWYASRKTEHPLTRDDDWLEQHILPYLPVHGRTYIPISEIDANWHNANWWYENFMDSINILKNMYVKVDMKANAYKGYLRSYITRLLFFINTYRAERRVAELWNFDLDIDNHNCIHGGHASHAEALPDFTGKNGHTIELKLCKSTSSIKCYIKQLNENFEQTKFKQFHNADFAMFLITRADKNNKHEVYFLDIRSKYAEPFELNVVDSLIDVDLIQVDEEGNITGKDLPALPLSLLFGLTPPWQDRPQN